MLLKFFFITTLFYSQSLFALEKCTKDSQKLFCRLLRCVEGVQWSSDKIHDPFLIVKNDGNYDYDTIIMPVDDGQPQFSFLSINSDSLLKYKFPESVKAGPKCEDQQPAGIIDLEGVCRSSLPFGLGCVFRKPLKMQVKPYRVSYWDGRKVGFLCTKLQSDAMGQVNLSKKTESIHENLKLITLLLKNKMKQLVRSISADRKNVNIKKVLSVIKNGKTVEDTGDCRYFLDGNTLNLVLEEINKKP